MLTCSRVVPERLVLPKPASIVYKFDASLYLHGKVMHNASCTHLSWIAYFQYSLLYLAHILIPFTTHPWGIKHTVIVILIAPILQILISRDLNSVEASEENYIRHLHICIILQYRALLIYIHYKGGALINNHEKIHREGLK